MTDELDLRLSAAFRSLDLPAAGPRLIDTLEGLRAAPPTRSSRANRHPWLATMAAAASIVFAAAVVVSQLGVGPFGPPSPTPSPTPTVAPLPAPTPSPDSTEYPGFTVASLLRARASGEVGSQQVVLVGWWTDRRLDVACGTPSPFPLIITCGDGQFGLTEDEEPIGSWDGGVFVAADGPALTPLLASELPAPGLDRSLIGLRDDQGEPHPPVFVTVIGGFDSPLADLCSAELRQACRDRFVIAEIIGVDMGQPLPTANPSATPPSADDPPPASFPQLVEDCRLPRTATLELGDPERLGIVSTGWIPFESLGAQPRAVAIMAATAPAWVYVAVTETDVPLTLWIADPGGSDRRFRYVGQAVCIGWDGMTGMFYSTVPGTTFQLWSDGQRVPLAVFPPES